MKVEKEAVQAAKTLFDKSITKLTVEKTEFYNNLTRWESALLISRYADKIMKKSKDISLSCNFKDTFNLDSDSSKEIESACKL
jgi:hypothetical protein